MPATERKHAGLDEGPIIPVAEQAIAEGSPERLVRALSETVREEVQRRFAHLMQLREPPEDDVARNREYVEAMLGLEVYAHHLHQAMTGDPHEGGHGHHHG